MTEEEIMVAKECLYDKTYTCPVCEEPVKEKAIKKGKTRVVSVDMDLDLSTDPIEQLFYDVIMCNSCGYTAAVSMFDSIMPKRKMDIINGISVKFKPRPKTDAYDITTSLERYKMAYIISVTKKAKSSELGYLSMKISWHYKRMKDIDNELMYIKNAYNNFISAYQTENLPVCGIDANTMNYLISYYAYRLKNKDESLKVLSNVIVNSRDNKRLLERALSLKEIILST